MKLSTKPRYGMRILAQIAADGGAHRPVSGREIARKQDISMAYMEQILIPMRNAGLVRSARGRNGGYLLEDPAAEISLLRIIELFEGKLDLVPRQDSDASSAIWERLSESLRVEARAISVADMAELFSRTNTTDLDFVI